MKALLVPTDFSPCAEYACKAGILLARQYQATIHFYHRLKIPLDWEKWSPDKKLERPEVGKKVEMTLERLRKWQKNAVDAGVNAMISYSAGDFLDNIQDYVTRENIDFVVIGSYGKSGKSEYFIGSHTQKVVRRLHCPVLVLKEELAQLDFKQVVFASGFDEDDVPVFELFLDFMKTFNPVIHLLTINTAGFFAQPYVLVKDAMVKFQKIAEPLKTEMHFYSDLSVDQGIRRFTEDLGIDLIGISNHDRAPLRRFIFGSSVEALVNHSTVPVLSIDFPEATT